MTFKIEATSVWNDEDVIKSYPKLSDFAFRCDEEEQPRRIAIRDDEGQLMWQQVGSYIKKRPKIEIKTLEDLINLLNSVDNPIIITKEDDSLSIEIYDGFRRRRRSRNQERIRRT